MTEEPVLGDVMITGLMIIDKLYYQTSWINESVSTVYSVGTVILVAHGAVCVTPAAVICPCDKTNTPGRITYVVPANVCVCFLYTSALSIFAMFRIADGKLVGSKK